MAAFDTLVAALTLNTNSVFTMAGVVVTALASIWAIRKVVKLANRS